MAKSDPPPGAGEDPRRRRRKKRTMTALVVFAFHILGFTSSIHAIMSVRTEQGAIAWAVSLNTFPYIAVPAYWVLGRSRFEGYVTARRGDLEEVAGVSAEAIEGARRFTLPRETVSAAGQAAEQLVGLPYLRGNSAELLVDGEATFGSILRGIASAEKYILFQFYIIHDDEIGREVKDSLVERARAGVRVCFLYDEIGSHDLPQAYLDDLRAAGAEVFAFNTRKGLNNRFQLNFRNHRKIVVVDGKVSWIGGHNVGDEYLGRDLLFGHWRDTQVRIEGPAATLTQLSFAEDWHWATGRVLEADWEPVASAEGDLPILIAPTGPADELETASLLFIHAINSAVERVWISSPYFVPDRPAITALQLAALRGVDVRILVPEKPDSLGVYLAAFSYLEEASRTGVKFYRYQDGFLHQKVVLIDDIAAAVGTANFDNRSFRLNFEITALIRDENFAEQVRRMFEDDFAESRIMKAGEYDAKPWWFQLGVRISRLMAPVL